ncbi:hypothetical protein DWX57_05230 [Coprococcus sp. AF19-8AC]|nr:hypothetical protein DWX57_05230 [Coprococcus sp. AF19-8AC]
MNMATKETKTANQTSEVIEPVVAEPKTESEPTGWTVSVNNSAAYCGIGAGGVQFANGKAEITSKRMADWFMEHDGYTVIPKK